MAKEVVSKSYISMVIEKISKGHAYILKYSQTQKPFLKKKSLKELIILPFVLVDFRWQIEQRKTRFRQKKKKRYTK